MKRTYETMVLLDNREVKKGWQNLKDEVCGLFSKHGAEIKSARRWDERRLTYPIKHQLRGTYMLMYFESETDQLGAIRRELEYSEPVLRYVTLACEEVPADAFEPEAEFDEAAVRVEDTSTLRAAAVAEAEAAPRRSSDGDEKASAKGDDAESGEAKAEAKADAGSDAKKEDDQ